MDKRSVSKARGIGRRVDALLLALLVSMAGMPDAAVAATIFWSGTGFSERWSDAGNWSPRLPAPGDDVVFTGAPAFATNTVDSNAALGSLTFGATAQLFNIHVAGSSALTFTALGIQNLTGSGGPIRQQLFADAGATGGTITFANASGIKLGIS